MQNNINNDICKNGLRATLQQSNKTDEIFMFSENKRSTNDRFKKKKILNFANSVLCFIKISV